MCRFSLLPLLSLFLLNEHIPSPHVLSEMYILHLSHRTVRGQCGAKEKNIGTTTFTHYIASTELPIDIYIVDKSCRLQITHKTASQFKKAWNKQG